MTGVRELQRWGGDETSGGKEGKEVKDSKGTKRRIISLDHQLTRNCAESKVEIFSV